MWMLVFANELLISAPLIPPQDKSAAGNPTTDSPVSPAAPSGVWSGVSVLVAEACPRLVHLDQVILFFPIQVDGSQDQARFSIDVMTMAGVAEGQGQSRVLIN